MEIIQIGAVKILDGQTAIHAEFNQYIKPKLFPELSKYCRSLTGIDQNSINLAATFPEVIEAFKNWIQEDDYRLWSWGDWDKKQLKQDGMLHGIDVAFTQTNHYNMAGAFRALNKVGKKGGLARAVQLSGLEFVGQHHDGLADATNLARIFLTNPEGYREYGDKQ